MQTWISTVVGKAQLDARPLRARDLPARQPWAAADRPGKSRPELAKRRGEVLRGLFPKLASWLESSAQAAHRREIEDYLAKAQNVFDLEERIRRLERRSDLPYF